MSDPHGIIGNYRKGGSMSNVELFDKVITIIYEDNSSHLEFMDNMGGEDCDCIIHNVLNYLHEYEVA
jgi:hypothetical protein